MRIEMVMPQMGESIAEGTILKWLKGVGDEVELDEDVLEISTDKVDSEIPSPATGTIAEILVKEGETVAIGTTLAIIETEGEDVAGKTESSEDAEKKAAERPSPRESSPHDASDHGGLEVREFRRATKKEQKAAEAEKPPEKKNTFISPLVQNIAADAGVSIEEVMKIHGSGRDGRVTKKDLLDYIAERDKAPAPKKDITEPAKTKAVEEAPESEVRVPAALEAPPEPKAQPVWRSADDQIVEMDRMRKMIAGHMVRSVRTSPHVVSYSEVDMNRIVQHRDSIKKQFKEREGINITYTSYFIYAAAKALQEFPYVNASVDGDQVILRKRINIGFAVELPNSGLIVPVIKNVDGLSLKGVAHGLHDLAEKARASRLSPDDVSGGTFSVTNVGVFGNISGAPIINQPQVAILGTGAIRKVPAVISTESGDAIAIRWRMIMSLSYDHRLIDGAMAGRFMAKLSELLEEFEE